MKRIILACAIAAAASGCYKAKIHMNPTTPVTRSASVDNAFHFSVIGIVELSSPVDLKAACGGGDSAAISERVSVAGGLVNMVFGMFIPIFEVMNPSVECGAAATAPAQANQEAPPAT